MPSRSPQEPRPGDDGRATAGGERREQRVLVTGGAGFIGSHLVRALLERGDRVLVLDDLSTGRAENLELACLGLDRSDALEFRRGSVLDAELVDRAVREVDGVIHLAAAVGVRLVLEHPVRTMHVNAEGTRIVLAAAARWRRRCLIASSSEVYGRSTELPFREDGPLLLGATSEPRWAYACSKAMGEWTALGHAAQDGLDVGIVRYFNVVGPRQRGRYGMVLPNFVRQALAEEPITVFGDGCQTRAFLDVRDAVRATLALFDRSLGDGRACPGAERVFNVGCSEELAIEGLARLVRELLGSSSTIVHMPYREAYGLSIPDLPRRVPDVSRLEAAIGFVPEHDIRNSIQAVASFQRGRRVAEGAAGSEARGRRSL